MGLLSTQMKRQWSEQPPAVLQTLAAACQTFTFASPSPKDPRSLPQSPCPYPPTPPPDRASVFLLCLHRTSPPLPGLAPYSFPGGFFQGGCLSSHTLPGSPVPCRQARSILQGMQGSTHSVPTSPLHQKLKSCQSPPRLQEASLAAAPPSSPPPPPGASRPSGMPFPLLGLAKVPVRGQGLAQTLFPGGEEGASAKRCFLRAPSLPSPALPWGQVASRSLAGSGPPLLAPA